MKILTIVKKTGYNFIRHYWGAFPLGSMVVHDAKQALELMPKFDVILFEWGNDLTAQIVNSEKFRHLQVKHKFKTAVRVHDHEVTKKFNGARRIDLINWGRVDRIWFINPAIQGLFIQLQGHRNKTFFLPNAVDPKFFTEHQSENKKAGLLSIYFRPRKRIDRVIEIAKHLPDWTFHVRSHIPLGHERFYDQYFKCLQLNAEGLGNVFFEHRDATLMIHAGYDYKDLCDWYQDKAVILSTSDHEGFHYAIPEAMLSGCMPVVWNWNTSEVFWGKYVVNSAEIAANHIRRYKPSGQYREYVFNRFHPDMLFTKLLNLL